MKLKVLKFLDLAVEYAVYGVILFIPVSISIIGIFASLAIVFFLAKFILSPDLKSIKDNRTLFLLILLFFVFMGLSLFNSGPLFNKSLKAVLIKWGRFPLFLWVITDTFRDSKRIARAVCVFLFSAAVVSLTVLTQKFCGFEFLRGRALLDAALVSTGPFENQNSLAAYLACVIPIILAFSLYEWRKIVFKISVFLVAGLLILSSFWTFSRGGWLGLVVGLIFVILFVNYHRIKKIFWRFFLSSCILVPLMAIALLFCRNKIGSNNERLTIIHSAWGMIKEHPLLGKGIGTFMDYSSLYANHVGGFYAHNCYLQIWAESGIFSLIAFILLAGYVLYRSIKTILIMSVSLDRYILVGLTAGLMGFLVHAFFDVHFYSFQLSFLFWTVLGLAVALISTMRTPAA